MTADDLPPRYHEWLEFCFGRFEGAHPAANHYDLIGEAQFAEDAAEILPLFAATMRRAGTDLIGYSDMALAAGLRTLFYPEPSSIADQLCSEFHPEQAHRAAIEGITYLYLDCLDARDLPLYTGKDVSDPRYELASVVFLLWDVSPLVNGQMPICHNAVLLALGRALSCRSDGCLQSALHGLGHLAEFMDENGSAKPIETFLAARPDLNPALAEYARDAADGCIL